MKQKGGLRGFLSFALCGLGLFLSGCAVGPDFETPASPTSKTYVEGDLSKKTEGADIKGGEVQTFLQGRDVPGDWWTLFRSKPLNALIEKALKNNPTLVSAQATWRQAEETLRSTFASLFPFVSVQPQYERIGQNYSALGLNEASPFQTYNLFNASVNVTYTLDAWGAIRRQVESAQAQLDVKKFLVEATYLTLITNIVTTAITEASLRAQMEAAEKLIDLQKKFIIFAEQKLKMGALSPLDVIAQVERLYNTQATLPPLKLALAQTRHAIAVLVGEAPNDAKLPIFTLEDFHLPTDIPVSLPALLVRQRPDIRAAEEALHAASAHVGVATASLLPQLNLTGSYGWSANFLANYFNPQNLLWNFTSGIVQPIFQAGSLLAQRGAAIAAFEAAMADYKATVLRAFQNVADTLRALEVDAQTLVFQTAAENAAKQMLAATQAQLKIGAVTYLNVLEAEQSCLEASISRVRTQAARYADTAALFQALGGGWWNRKECMVVSKKSALVR